MTQTRDLFGFATCVALALGVLSALAPRIEIPGPLPLNPYAEWPIGLSFLGFSAGWILNRKLRADKVSTVFIVSGGLLAFGAIALSAVGIFAV